jgi:hypothetical protein
MWRWMSLRPCRNPIRIRIENICRVADTGPQNRLNAVRLSNVKAPPGIIMPKRPMLERELEASEGLARSNQAERSLSNQPCRFWLL